MEYTSTHLQLPSFIVCFGGSQKRINIDVGNCKKGFDPFPKFSSNINYKDENGNVFRLIVESVKEIGYPTKCNVFVYNSDGSKLVAKRFNVQLRFGKKIFE
jgi:hypothetical protein